MEQQQNLPPKSPPKKSEKKQRGKLGYLIVIGFGIAAVATMFTLGRGIWLLLSDDSPEPTAVVEQPTLEVIEAEPQLIVEPTAIPQVIVIEEVVVVESPTQIVITDNVAPEQAVVVMTVEPIPVYQDIETFGWNSNAGDLRSQGNAFQYTVPEDAESGSVFSEVLTLPADQNSSLVFTTTDVTADTWFDVQLFEADGEQRQHHLMRAVQANTYCVGLQNAVAALDGTPVRLVFTTNAPTATLNATDIKVQFADTACR